MSDTITTYRQAMADMLKDRANEVWSADELDAALRLALAELSQRLPNSLEASLTLAQAGRSVPTTSLSGCMWVEEAWWPYSEGDYPPNPVPFEQRQGEVRLRVADLPAAGEIVRLLYAARQTVEGLDAAASTSVPEDWRGTVVMGAAAYAALAKSAAMSREYNWPNWSAGTMQRWGETMLAFFQARLRSLRPASVQPWVSWG
jgi:hypothetical protein